MHPHEARVGAHRKYTAGTRYLMREDGHVIPRSISSHEVPAGFKAMIAEDEYTLVDDLQQEDALAVKDAATLTGAAISFDVGHAKPNRASVPVSTPRANDDHQVRERVKAAEKKIEEDPDSTKNAIDTKKLKNRGRRGRAAPDLSNLVNG